MDLFALFPFSIILRMALHLEPDSAPLSRQPLRLAAKACRVAETRGTAAGPFGRAPVSQLVDPVHEHFASCR